MTNLDLVGEVPAEYLVANSDERTHYSLALSGEIQTGPEPTLEARTAIGALTGLVNAIYRASEASELAQSHRDYRVGASVAAYNFKTGFLGFFDGYNVKPVSGKSPVNIHAEQMAIAKARLNRLDRVLGVAVYADPEDDDANPSQTATLRPCGRCLDMFTEINEVDERTLVLGSNPDFTKCELYTVGGLLVAKARQTTTERLVDETFSLASEQDFEEYDRNIKPNLLLPIHEIYGVQPQS